MSSGRESISRREFLRLGLQVTSGIVATSAASAIGQDDSAPAIRLVGPEGATLYLLSTSGGRRTELQVGKPYTTAATGHETWIGRTGEILLTVMADGDFAPDKGNLLAVRAGAPPRVVAKGYKFNHIGVSRCGRFFCCDDWRGTAKIVIGSIRTGKTAVVCESRASMSSPQNTHAHPT